MNISRSFHSFVYALFPSMCRLPLPLPSVRATCFNNCKGGSGGGGDDCGPSTEAILIKHSTVINYSSPITINNRLYQMSVLHKIHHSYSIFEYVHFFPFSNKSDLVRYKSGQRDSEARFNSIYVLFNWRHFDILQFAMNFLWLLLLLCYLLFLLFFFSIHIYFI